MLKVLSIEFNEPCLIGRLCIGNQINQMSYTKHWVTLEYLQIITKRSSLRKHPVIGVLCWSPPMQSGIIGSKFPGTLPGALRWAPTQFPLGARVAAGPALWFFWLIDSKKHLVTAIRELGENQGLFLTGPGGYTPEARSTRSREKERDWHQDLGFCLYGGWRWGT